MEVGEISQGRQITLKSVDTNKSHSNLQSKQDNNIVELNSNSKHENLSAKEIKDLKKSVDRLNGFMKDDHTKVVYEMHDKFKNDIMIKVVDSNTGEILSEVPPRKILDMVARMCEVIGVIFDKKA